MLSTLNESRAVWLQRVSDAAAALSAMRASECPDASPKPSQVEIKHFGRAEMQASDLCKYKLSAVLVGMVAAVLAIGLTAFPAIEQSPLTGMWHQQTQHAIGLSSSLSLPIPSIG